MLWIWLTTQAFAADLLVDVGDDWCATLTAAAAGDRVLLAAGTHTGVCSVTPAGDASSPVTLMAADTERRATLTTDSTSANLLDLHGGHLVVQGIDFGPTPVNVEAIRWHAGEGLTVSDCTFAFIGGQSIVASTAGATYASLRVEDNTFHDLTGAAVTVGCRAGAADCSAADVIVRRNQIEGVTGGAGVVLEVDAVGQVAWNTITGTLGPAVRVGGDQAEAGGVEAPPEGDPPSTVVEGNHLVGSAESATLLVEGGPVLVRNNVLLSGATGALSAAGPQMDHVHVVGNSFGGASGPVVTLADWTETATLSFQDNAVWDPSQPGAGLPAAVAGQPWGGNVACSSETACFEDLAGGDPSPRAGGELVGVGVVVEDGLLDADLCGVSRVAGDPAGALVASLAEPLLSGSDTDPTVHCTTGGDTGGDSGDSGIGDGGGTGTVDQSPDDPVGIDTAVAPDLPRWSAAEQAGETGGVSCSSAGAAAGWLAAVVGLVAAGRRRLG